MPASEIDTLINAACSSEAQEAKRMLDAEPALAAGDLYAACACGEVAAVEGFLSGDTDAVRRAGGPLDAEPLSYVCFSRLLRADRARRAGMLRVARLLLDRGADANAFFWHDSGNEKWLQSTLYGAAGIANDVELVTTLFDAGARVDPRDKEVLYHATEFPDVACLRLVLERGGPAGEQVTYCLARATDFEYPAHVAAFLAAGADVNFRVRWEGLRTQLHKAVYLGRSAGIVRLLIDAGGDVNAVDEHGVSVWRSAVLNGDAAVVELLRNRGARAEAIDEAEARRGAPITLCVAASRGDVATIDRLIDSGAPVDGPAAPDRTPPLHWAAWRGQFDAVRRLVERGADVNWVNGYGGNAVGAAVHGSENCFDVNGGPGMRLPEEAVAGDYAGIVAYLIGRGARAPGRVSGSEAVRGVLRGMGAGE